MSNTSFIITETRNGRATPNSVWLAESEADYTARVIEANIRSDGVDEIESADDAKAFTEEKLACSVRFITEKDFHDYDVDSWESRVIKLAVMLGWIDEPSVNNDQ